MDLTNCRWHPTKYYHHLITSYLSKAKEKYRPLTPITICTPFLLEDLASSTRTVETDIMFCEKDFRRHQLVIIPAKTQSKSQGEIYDKTPSSPSSPSSPEGEIPKGRWILYIVVRGETMLSRFPGERDKGNLVIIIIGDRDTTHEKVILQMLYQKSRYRLRNDYPVYGYRLANTDEIRQKYLQSSCTKYVDWVKGKDNKEEWMDAWGLTGIAEAVLKDTTKTIVELLKGEGEVVKFEIPPETA
ncbi:hypothetical protein TWF106_001603 [Orbilia oligospora]|uniref:Uncharacterized protein n=2 Tax=Orbilia oligospora TaxID=2813651 RepID=A0A6G1MJR9_ORBOL|nr:hypothetical protein TWF679_010248 [Orbilia oligospora]KAF3204241.1 hypothetical protein TWF106_001603 [Orbilia oligospora]KAF3210661.1 hypothetical protein TWF191_011141 [Orbilia oligospora]KAF3261108.1 hypothetical protein TWF192_009040 [Orbilia oligospora]